MIVNKYANGNGGGGTGSTITVDAALSSSSTNPVQNKIITNALGNYVSSGDVQDIVDEAVSSSMTGYATEQYVDDAIAGIVIPEPPADYATTGDVADAVAGLASESYVDDAISTATEHMVTTDDLQDYATEQYVDDAVNGLAQSIGMLGMVNDVTESNGTVTVQKTTIQEGQLVTGSTSFDIVTSGDIQNFVTSGDVATAITAATENFATEQYVDDAIAAIPTGSTVTVDSALSSSSTNPVQNKVIANKFENYATKAQLDSGWTDSTEIVISDNNSLYKATIETSFGVVGEVTFKNTNISNVFAYHYEIPQSEQGQGVPWWIKLSGLTLSTSVYYDFEGNNADGMKQAWTDYPYEIARRADSVPGFVNTAIVWCPYPLTSDSCEIILDMKKMEIWCSEYLPVASYETHPKYLTEDDLDEYVTKEEYVNGVTGGTDIEFASGSTVWSVYDSIDGNNNFFNTNQPGIYMIKQTCNSSEYSVSNLTDGEHLYWFEKVDVQDSGIDGELDVEYSYVPGDDMDPTQSDTISWRGNSGGLPSGVYYLILNTNNQTIKLSAKPVIPHVYPSLDDFVTSGDVQDMVEDVVATAITIDSALSTGSTNPVQNQVITNALANFVQSTSVRTIVSCTQAAYDAMATHDPNTFYIITGVNS